MAAWNPMDTTTPLDYFRSLVASDAQFPLLEAAASLAHVEHPHSWAQLKLATDHFELGNLRFFQGLCTFDPVSATVGHIGVEHGLKDLVAHVVVHSSHNA